MLLRSSSTPISSSLLYNSTGCSGSSPGPDTLPRIRRTRSFCPAMSSEDCAGRATPTRILFDSDLRHHSKPKKFLTRPTTPRAGKIEECTEHEVGSTFLISSGVGSAATDDECLVVVAVPERERVPQTLVAGGGACGGRRGSGAGGGGCGSDRSGSGHWRGPESIDAYYEMMIQANPGNPLLLGNYAKFLKEVKGDLSKAEEYCGRAILANPSDASVLSLYADLIWQSNKDSERTEAYFNQAVKADPNDCFVLASYAHFLWDDDEVDEVKTKHEAKRAHSAPSAAAA